MNDVIFSQYNALFTGLEVSGQYAFAKINDFDIISNFMIDFLKVTEHQMTKLYQEFLKQR